MIYIGVHCTPNAFELMALSSAFAPLAQARFSGIHHETFQQWLLSLKDDPEEAVHWFFDEYQFDQQAYPMKLFQFNHQTDALFVVNHRALCNMSQFMREGFAKYGVNISNIETQFLLASARRIFSQQQLKPVNPQSNRSAD